MSFLSSIILPKIEKELISLEPQAADFIISQLDSIASEVISWVEKKRKELLDSTKKEVEI